MGNGYCASTIGDFSSGLYLEPNRKSFSCLKHSRSATALSIIASGAARVCILWDVLSSGSARFGVTSWFPVGASITPKASMCYFQLFVRAKNVRAGCAKKRFAKIAVCSRFPTAEKNRPLRGRRSYGQCLKLSYRQHRALLTERTENVCRKFSSKSRSLQELFEVPGSGCSFVVVYTFCLINPSNRTLASIMDCLIIDSI